MLQLPATGLADSAYVYVPSGCKGGRKACRLHLSLHGCWGYKDYPEMVAHLGFLEWGEANDIIILYPQAAGDHATGTAGAHPNESLL